MSTAWHSSPRWSPRHDCKKRDRIRKRRAYTESHRVPYGREVIIPAGPAKGFTLGAEITGPPRNA